MSLSKTVLTACLVVAAAGCSASPPMPAADSTAASVATTAHLVRDVRAANTSGDLALARQLVESARTAEGVTPTVLVAQSWVGRGALAVGDLETAEAVGRKTYADAQEVLKGRQLDD